MAEAAVVFRPVSGRSWKSVEKKRSSALKKKAALTWEARLLERDERKKIKEAEAELLESRKLRLAEAKAKREEKKARRQGNEFKNSVYQVIKNDKTLKSMSKKQTRMIKRTRMSKEGQIELVDAYAPTLGDRTPKRQRR